MLDNKIINKRNAVKTLAETLNVKGVISSYPKEAFNGRLNYQIALESATLNFTDDTVDILSTVGNISFNRDSRKAAHYALDLVYGWQVEDIIAKHLHTNGLTVNFIGADRERKFLKSGAITSDLDLRVANKDITADFDVFFDANNYWAKNDKIDIRKSKWNTLLKQNAAMICVSNAGFAIIDTNNTHTITANPLWGGKESATITGIKNQLQPLELLADTLKQRLT